MAKLKRYFTKGVIEAGCDEAGRGCLAGEAIGDGVADGDVSHGRLLAKGFEESPSNFHFLQIAAPVFLLILTRLRMPVSTTFILLTSFAASPAAVGKVLAKSFSGYILSFIIGIVVFLFIARLTKRLFVGKAHGAWTIAQWLISGTLWSVWLMQDAANKNPSHIATPGICTENIEAMKATITKTKKPLSSFGKKNRFG